MIAPLEINRKLLTWICVHPADNSTTTWWRWNYKLFAFLVFTLNFTAATATLRFLLENRSENLKDDIYAFAITICYFAANVAMMLEYRFRHSVVAVFEHLVEIYDAIVSDRESFRYLEQANVRNKQIFTRYWKYFIGVGTYGMFFCVAVITYTLCIYSYGSFDRSFVFVPYNYVLSWNQYTTLGYFGEILFSFASGVAYLIVFGSMALLFVGCGLHYRAFYEIYKYVFSQLGTTRKNHNDLVLLCKLIKFNISAKDLFSITSGMFGVMGTIQLLYGLVLLAVFIFKAEMEFRNFDITLLSPIPSMANCVFYVYLYTYFGNETNDSFENISNLLYESDWIKLPNNLQRTLLLMMHYAQQPMFYTTFGGFPLNIDTLGRFAKTCYNYYMVCKTFAAK